MNWRKVVVFILLFLKRSKIRKYLREIEKVESLSLNDKKAYQKEKLFKVLKHASKNIPYYRSILKKINLTKMSEFNYLEFEKVDFLTKKIIHEQGSNLFSEDYKKRNYYENTSGGSTGEPAKFIQDKEYNDWNIANKIFIKSKCGQQIGDRELRFWGSERDLLEGKDKLSVRFRNWVYNRKEFNTFRMSEDDMNNYINKWNIFKPKWVEAYVQSIYEFAKYLDNNDYKVFSPPNGILTSAGVLYPHMKEKIEKVFRCKVYNRYGSREVGDMACGDNELFLSLWNNYVEVIDEQIYVTTLNNYSMPLIRYDIGDTGVMTDGKASLKEIKGRVNHIIKLKNGNRIDSAAITSALYFDLNGKLLCSFSKYQFVQKDYDKFELNVVVQDKTLWDEEKFVVIDVLQRILGNTVNLEIKEVKDIKECANGKFEYVRCEI